MDRQEVEKKLKRVEWIRTVINHHLNDVEDILRSVLKSDTTPKKKDIDQEIDDIVRLLQKAPKPTEDDELFKHDLGMM